MSRSAGLYKKQKKCHIEYCSPLKSFQHSVSLFLSTIIIGEGKVEEEKKKKEGLILRERDELKVGACSLCHGKIENVFSHFPSIVSCQQKIFSSGFHQPFIRNKMDELKRSFHYLEDDNTSSTYCHVNLKTDEQNVAMTYKWVT